MRLKEIATLLNGYAFKSKNYVSSGIRVMRIANVQDGYISDEQPCYYPCVAEKEIEKYMLQEGDLLVSLTGNVGRVGLLKSELLPAALNQRVSCIRLKNDNVSKKYLFFFLRRKQFVQECVTASKGVAQLNLSTKWLADYEIPIPPLSEQERIVTRIEELFSELDKAVETLQTTKQQLAVYRQAVLNEAFSNSESWPQYEFGKIMDVVRNGYGNKPADSGDYRILTIGSVRSLALDLCNYRLNNQPFDECDLIAENDLLFTRYNGSKEFVGVCAVVPKLKTEYAYPDKLIKFRPHIQDADYSKYLAYYSSSGIARKYLRSKIKTTSGQNGIAGTDIKKMTIHIPSMEVIHRIVFEIESRLSVCESIEQTVDTALAQADAMRQSILKQAFEGGFNQ